MLVPDGLWYSTDHEWVRLDANRAVIGITDYAQDALGDVVYVNVPTVGAAVIKGDSCGEVESTKSVSDIYAPVGGTVVEANMALDDHPELLNGDPYGEGWLFVIELPENAADGSVGGSLEGLLEGLLDGLLDANGYRALTET